MTQILWDAFRHLPESLKLYGYWRSSATWRVRWALELKEQNYTYVPINLLRAENTSDAFLKINPQGRVPTLEIDGKYCLSQSVSILEWIEETYEGFGQSLLPENSFERAHVRTLVQIINADTTPLQIPMVQKRHSDDAEERKLWAQDFIRRGLKDFDLVCRDSRDQYCVGKKLSMADLFLVPQIYNAYRFEVTVSKEFPELEAIYQRALLTEACKKSHPESQVDAVPV